MPKHKRDAPPGLVTERVLRSMIKAVGKKLKNPDLTVKESLALLREQKRLSKELKQSAAASLEMQIAREVERVAAANREKYSQTQSRENTDS